MTEEVKYANALEASMHEDIEAINAEAEKENADAKAAQDAALNDVPDEDAEAAEGDADKVAAAEGEEKPAADEKKPEADAEKSDVARLAYEAREAKRQLAELQKRLDEKERAEKAEKEAALNTAAAASDPEPSKDADPDAWLEWRVRQVEKEANVAKQKATELEAFTQQREQEFRQQKLIEQATSEFVTLEAKFKEATPDYDDVAEHFVTRIRQDIGLRYPNATEAQINEAARNQLLQIASSYANQGQNPVEALYKLTKERLGYVPKQAAAAASDKAKPDLAKIAANKAKSASGAAAGGGASKPSITAEDAVNMSTAEFAKLSPAEQRRLMQEGL